MCCFRPGLTRFACKYVLLSAWTHTLCSISKCGEIKSKQTCHRKETLASAGACTDDIIVTRTCTRTIQALGDAKLAGVLDDRADESAVIEKKSAEEANQSLEQLKQLDREVLSAPHACVHACVYIHMYVT